MPFKEPQYARPIKEKENFKILPREWAAEEKFDGHRLIVDTGSDGKDLFGKPTVTAWSRNGIVRILPPHIRLMLERFPAGIYDGELIVPKQRSYGVTVLEDETKRVFMVFDAMELVGKDVTKYTYDERRGFLREIFNSNVLAGGIGIERMTRDGEWSVKLAESFNVDDMDEVTKLRDIIWARDGEGLILKKRDSVYQSGKRPKDWRKVKALRSAKLAIIGFHEGLMGPTSVIVLRDGEGNETSVKWKNLEMLERTQADPKKFIGQLLWIEYQERTPDGSYRHPRWDHLDNDTDARPR